MLWGSVNTSIYWEVFPQPKPEIYGLAEKLITKYTFVRGWKDGNTSYIVWTYLINFSIIILMTNTFPNVLVACRREV